VEEWQTNAPAIAVRKIEPSDAKVWSLWYKAPKYFQTNDAFINTWSCLLYSIDFTHN